jgi:predicted MPP superfamily phosphohydrolase
MDRASVAAALKVQPARPVDLSWDTTGMILTVSPRGNWSVATLTTVTIQAGALTRSGEPLARPARTVFMTRAPANTTITPTAQLGPRVALDTTFLVGFSRPVDLETLQGAIRLDPPTPGTIRTITRFEGLTRFGWAPVEEKGNIIALTRALDGFRIVQISDIHIGPVLGRGFAAALTERVNALAPDLVAVTGDLVDGEVERLRDEVEPFAALRARHGVYFVTGNHDVYSGGEPWVARVRELGIRPLRNERVEIGGAAGFDLAGVDDHRGDWVRGSSEDLGKALAGRDPARAVVLLAHDPGTFRRAATHDVDLQLSGHTHGGQIWPFNFIVRLAVPWVAGLHRTGASQLYVSRGSGFWGPPMRLFAPAEITEIVLSRS